MDISKRIKGWIDGIQGDKVIIIVLILLYVLSALALFSARSGELEVVRGHTDRVTLFFRQIIFIGICGTLVFAFYWPGIRFFRFFSQFGFGVSFILLSILLMKIRIPGVIEVPQTNDAVRYIKLFGKVQIHVFEVTKVAMILYLAWALQALKDKKFWVANTLSSKYKSCEFLGKPLWQAVFYILLPLSLVCVGILSGSTSSFLFIGGVLLATIIIGGLDLRLIGAYLAIMLSVLLLGYGLYSISGKKAFAKIFNRFDSVSSGRIQDFITKGAVDQDGETLDLTDRILNAPNIDERNKIVDEYIQTEGAKIAIHEGSVLGKGPGRSTQKYKVPLIFSDYMYSFLIEEYGIFIGIFVLMLFMSLFARGIMLTYQCKNPYAKTAVGGLSLLICGQALMHMLINVGIVPVTGQTLPIVSYGTGSMIMFSAAFGILINISKQVKKQMDKESRKLENDPLIVQTGDSVADRLNELEQLEILDRLDDIDDDVNPDDEE